MIELPHKWPGVERVRVILASLRLLGVDIPMFGASRMVKANGSYQVVFEHYDKLSPQEQKKRWESFRLTIGRHLRLKNE